MPYVLMYSQRYVLMKPNDFAYYLTGFLTRYLTNEVGASNNTISSYRDTFLLFLAYMKDYKKISAEKLTLAKIKKEDVERFLEWLESVRGCCASTRNVRL